MHLQRNIHINTSPPLAPPGPDVWSDDLADDAMQLSHTDEDPKPMAKSAAPAIPRHNSWPLFLSARHGCRCLSMALASDTRRPPVCWHGCLSEVFQYFYRTKKMGRSLGLFFELIWLLFPF